MTWLNESEIQWAARRDCDCPNLRKAGKLLLRLMEAVNRQSDGWSYWPAPAHAASKLMDLIQQRGGTPFSGAPGTITDRELEKAITPIRSMVTKQRQIQARYGGTFEFDVDAALQP